MTEYRCSVCGHAFQSREGLEAHWTDEHPERLDPDAAIDVPREDQVEKTSEDSFPASDPPPY